MEMTQWLDALNKALDLLATGIADHLFGLLGALILVVLGWILARVLRATVVRLLTGLGRHVPAPGLAQRLEQSGLGRQASETIGGFVYWTVLILFVTAATELLGLPVARTFFAGAGEYLPSVLAALLIVFAGFLLSNLARRGIVRAASAAQVAYGDLLGRMAQGGILLVAVVIAIDQIGIDVEFLIVLLGIVIGTTFGAMALAFGLGARTAVSNILGCHYLTQVYRVGHRIRIGSVEGRILKITPTAVILDSPSGQVMVPAKDFGEMASVLLAEEG